MILLTPGPCMTSDSVRQAAALPDLNHRDPQFEEIVSNVRQRLVEVYRGSESWVPYLIGGSGTAAVEAMVTSCIHSGPVLVVENGYYSARIRQILEVHNIPFEPFELGWQEGWTDETLNHLEQVLSRGFEALLVVHNETTLGRLNPVERIARLCRPKGTRVLVDAMSSFGADPIDFSNLDVVVSSANKCLHGIPGVSFVLVQPKFATSIREYPKRSFYLSLPLYEGDRPPLTAPVPSLRALHQALKENPDGQARRLESYQSKLALLRQGLTGLGFQFAVAQQESSCTLSCPTIPSGWTSEQWLSANQKRGFMLYECKGDLRERYFQASVMGEVTRKDISAWIEVVRDLL